MLLSLGTRGTQTSCPSPASSEMKGAPCWARVPRVPEELALSETLQSSRLFPALPPVSHFLINIFTLHHPEFLLSPHIPAFHPHDTYLFCPVSRTESRPCQCCPASRPPAATCARPGPLPQPLPAHPPPVQPHARPFIAGHPLRCSAVTVSGTCV